MGFFSDLAKNITGGWADLSMSVAPARRGESATVTVNFSVKDDPVDVSKIAVKVRCQEIVQTETVRTTPRPGGQMQNGGHGSAATTTSTQSGTKTESLYQQEVVAAPAQQFEGGTQHTFTVDVPIPAHLPPSFRGRNARIEWQAYASADMKGNDPDSGWQTFEVQ